MKLIWSSSNLQIDVTMTTRCCSHAKLRVVTNLKFVKLCVNLLIGPTLGKLVADEDVLSKNGLLLFYLLHELTKNWSCDRNWAAQPPTAFVVPFVFYSRFFQTFLFKFPFIYFFFYSLTSISQRPLSVSSLHNLAMIRFSTYYHIICICSTWVKNLHFTDFKLPWEDLSRISLRGTNAVPTQIYISLLRLCIDLIHNIHVLSTVTSVQDLLILNKKPYYVTLQTSSPWRRRSFLVCLQFALLSHSHYIAR